MAETDPWLDEAAAEEVRELGRRLHAFDLDAAVIDESAMAEIVERFDSLEARYNTHNTRPGWVATPVGRAIMELGAAVADFDRRSLERVEHSS